MSSPFKKYILIKDKVCIGYFGAATEHLVQLRELRPNIENEFPGIEIYLSCNDIYLDYFKQQNKIIPCSQLKTMRREFGAIYEITRDMKQHPIEQFLELSKIPIKIEIKRINTDSNKCLICDKGEYPTERMTSNQRQHVLKLVREKGFRPVFGDDFSDAGWVVGVECAEFYEAAFAGIKTSLISTGIGTSFFQKLFPGYEILKIQT